jgi:hypothetical protein
MAWTDRVQDDVSTVAEAMARVRAMREKFHASPRRAALVAVPPAEVSHSWSTSMATADQVPVALFFAPEPVAEAETSPQPNAEPADIVPAHPIALTTVVNGRVKTDVIMRIVCAHFGVSVRDLLPDNRWRRMVVVRQVVMYFSRAEGWTLNEVGRRIGGRDHTTVLHGVRNIEAKMQTDDEIREAVTLIGAKIATVRTIALAEAEKRRADMLAAAARTSADQVAEILASLAVENA